MKRITPVLFLLLISLLGCAISQKSQKSQVNMDPINIEMLGTNEN